MTIKINRFMTAILVAVSISYFSFIGLVFMAEGADVDIKGESKTESGKEETGEYIQRLEKRISDLEAIVKDLLKDKKLATEVSDKDAQQPKEVVVEEDEWEEEPVIEKPAVGRDKDARRRITEIETWRRKLEAKIAKEKEEVAKKAKIEFSGKYRIRFNLRDNLHLNNPTQFWEFDDSTYFDHRFELRMDASYGPISTRIILDKGNFVFDWKEGSDGTQERWGEFLTANTLFARELYLQYTGKFLLKAGRQTIDDAHGGVVLQGPDDAIKLVYPLGKTPIGRVSTTLAYLALAGGYNDYTEFLKTGPPAGDRSAVFGRPNKLDGWFLNFNIKPTRNLTIEPYLLKVFDRGEFGDPDLNLDKDFDMTTTPRDGAFEPLYLGAAFSGRTGNISYHTDLIWLTGSYSTTRDIDAYAFLLGGDYNLKSVDLLKNFSFGLEFGRGSGNKAEDRETTGTVKDFNALWTCRDRRKFGNIFSEDLHAGIWIWDSNLSNVTFLRAIADFEPFDKLETSLWVSKLWTTESVFIGHGPVRDWSRGLSPTTEKTRDLGWEIDLNLDYHIFKFWNVFTEAGYFIPGDVYRQPDGQEADPALELVIGTEFVF